MLAAKLETAIKAVSNGKEVTEVLDHFRDSGHINKLEIVGGTDMIVFFMADYSIFVARFAPSRAYSFTIDQNEVRSIIVNFIKKATIRVE